MAYHAKEDSSSSLVWFVTGAAIGAVLGVLYSPKAGTEVRGSLGDYARDFGRRGRSLAGRISDRIPARVKAAAGFGAIKSGGAEALREARSSVEDRLS
jgi:gas vesicle protein